MPEKSRRVRPAAKRDQAENKMSAFAQFRIIQFYFIGLLIAVVYVLAQCHALLRIYVLEFFFGMFPWQPLLRVRNLVAPCIWNLIAARQPGVQIRGGYCSAYAAARCSWCTAPRSVATKICITSHRQCSAAYNNFITIFFYNYCW